jgi:hypothetical protein
VNNSVLYDEYQTSNKFSNPKLLNCFQLQDICEHRIWDSFFSCERDKQSRRGWCFSIILSLFIVRGVLYNKVKLFICYCEKLFFIVFFHCKRVVTSKKNLLFVPIEFKNSLLSRALKVKRVRIFYFSNLSLRQSNEHFHCKRAVTSKKK